VLATGLCDSNVSSVRPSIRPSVCPSRAGLSASAGLSCCISVWLIKTQDFVETITHRDGQTIYLLQRLAVLTRVKNVAN